jgi:hypothetical protein
MKKNHDQIMIIYLLLNLIDCNPTKSKPKLNLRKNNKKIKLLQDKKINFIRFYWLSFNVSMTTYIITLMDNNINGFKDYKAQSKQPNILNAQITI